MPDGNPSFDPSQPFQTIGAPPQGGAAPANAAPAFDPGQSFQVVPPSVPLFGAEQPEAITPQRVVGERQPGAEAAAKGRQDIGAALEAAEQGYEPGYEIAHAGEQLLESAVSPKPAAKAAVVPATAQGAAAAPAGRMTWDQAAAKFQSAESGAYGPAAAVAARSLAGAAGAAMIPAGAFYGALGAAWSGGSEIARQQLAGIVGDDNAGAMIEGANLVAMHMAASGPEVVVPPLGSRYLPREVEGEVIPPQRPAPRGLPQPPEPVEGTAQPAGPQPPPAGAPEGTGAPPQPAAAPVRPRRPQPTRPTPPMPTITTPDALEEELERVDGAGTSQKPVDIRSPGDTAVAGQKANPEPSEAQIEAGNYAHGHATFQGIPISIENAAGSVRRGVGPDGKPWETTVQHPYGYIKRSEGADGEHVDTYIGPHPDSGTAFVVDQIDPQTGKLDEHKAVLGARSPAEAAAIYDAGFSDGSGPSRRAAITAMPIPEFKDWIKNGQTTQSAAPPPATARQLHDDILDGAVRPQLADVAQRYRIPNAQAAALLNQASMRSAPAIERASSGREEKYGPISQNPEDWTWRRVPDDRREAGLQQLSRLAYRRFGIDRSKFASDSDFTDATDVASLEREEIGHRAQELGITPHPDATNDEIRAQIDEREAIALQDEMDPDALDSKADEKERWIEHDAKPLPLPEQDIPWGHGEPAQPPGKAEAQPSEARPPPSAGIERGTRPAEGAGAIPPAAGRRPTAIAGAPPGERGEAPAVGTEPVAAPNGRGGEVLPDDEAEKLYNEAQSIMRRLPSNIGKARQEGRLSGNQIRSLERLSEIEKLLPPTSEQWQRIAKEHRAAYDARAAEAASARADEQSGELGRIGLRPGDHVYMVTPSVLPGVPGTRYDGVIKLAKDGTAYVAAKGQRLDPFRNRWTKAEPGAPAAAPRPAPGFTEVGKNHRGQALYEDANRVRSYVENGVRITEPVQMVPTREGMQIATDRGNHPEFRTTDEVAEAHGAAPRPGGDPEALAALSEELGVEPSSQPGRDFLYGWEQAKREPGARLRPPMRHGRQGFDAYRRAHPEAPTPPANPQIGIADAIARRLEDMRQPGTEPISPRELQGLGMRLYGSKLAEGTFDRSDLYDALELGVNKFIRARAGEFDPRADEGRAKEIANQLAELKNDLPTQTVRAGEKDLLQQFSTPPDYSYAATWVANLTPDDRVIEPSAGTGSLAVHAMNSGAEVVVNELSAKRAALVESLGPARVYHENAEQLHNILPASEQPTAVVMNPPFSSAGERMAGKRDLDIGAQHIEQALKRLQPGGRLVAIVGGGTNRPGAEGMSMTAPHYREWWARIGAENRVLANVRVSGDIYKKYGTAFPTRLLVIDKLPPSGEAPITGQADTAAELIGRLAGVRNARVEAGPRGEQAAVQPSGAGVVAARPPGGERPQPVVPATGAAGPGAAGVLAGAGERVPVGPGAGGRPVAQPGARPSEAQPLVRPEPERPTGAGAEPVPHGGTPSSEDVAGSRAGGNGDVLQPPSGGERPLPAGSPDGEVSETVRVDEAAADPAHAGEITEDVYEPYRPQRVTIAGARAHPGELVQSAAMASVLPPKPMYAPHLPKEVVGKGLLSDAQLEAIVYAGQAHSQMLPAAEGEPAQRRGFFIGDGTGVGKGREISGIILDNWQQGREKHVWLSENRPLVNDARRDWKSVGQKPDLIFDVSKTKPASDLQAKEGIAFLSYDTLKSAAKGGYDEETKKPAKGRSRLDQIVDWVGPDFDGVIAFDESHNLANSLQSKGERGTKDAAAKAITGVELQRRLPNARVVYVSATGATEVSNLAYAERLGLWGRGSAFPSKQDFISKVSSGGIAAMELVARDMKALGHYVARNLSYRGVDYDRVEHVLSPEQREIYDKLAEGWQVTLNNINDALSVTKGEKDKDAKSRAMSAYWGTHQRFFNQVITSMQMPSVVGSVERDIKEGRQAVLQLVNTNEAAQERALGKIGSEEEIEDLDMTPRDQLLQMVEHSFPIYQYEEFTDAEGNVRARPVVDSQGNPVVSAEAVAMRDRLLDELASIRVPEGPLEILLNHFGTDKVAEVTGRKRRVVRKPDKDGQMRAQVESRPVSANITEADAFQSAKKPILVFSQAGGTGRSYHAEIGTPSEKMRRSHYLVQAGWRADKAIQGFGRTHRTNEASQPVFHLVTTDLNGQKRFISSIARRLSQLGALTKGERRAGDQGLFSARDNLESQEARDSLVQFWLALHKGEIPGISIGQFERQSGLRLVDPKTGGLRKELPGITQFLNRLLSFKIDLQNQVFNEFASRLDDTIDRAAAAGTLDTGVETVRADKITKEHDQPVYKDPESGAETRYARLLLSNKTHPVPFDRIIDGDRLVGYKQPLFFVRNRQSGKTYAVAETKSHTDAKTGAIIDQYRIADPLDYRYVAQHTIDGYDAEKRWEKLEGQKARAAWDADVAKVPEYKTEHLHLVTGAVLPIWDRLPGNPKVYRLQTDAGERMLGRVIPNDHLTETLRALGAEGAGPEVTPQQAADRIMGGARAALANGWSIRRSLVAGEQRIELIGPDYRHDVELSHDGVFRERIGYATRYFIPSGDRAAEVIARVTARRPITELSAARPEGSAFERAGERAPFRDQYVRLAHDVVAEARPTEQYTRHEAALTKAVNQILERVAPGARRRAVGRMEGEVGVGTRAPIGGAYYQEEIGRAGTAHVIAWSLLSPDAMGTARHEAIHYLYRSGLLTDQEWQTLRDGARREGWIGQHRIDERYPGASDDLKLEEAIADHFAAWQRGGAVLSKLPQWLRPIFQKLLQAYRQIGAVARRVLGKDATADDVFARVEAGEVGRRGAGETLAEHWVRTGRLRGTAAERAPEEEPPLLPTREATPEELAARERAQQKALAEAKMKGRKVAKKPQEVAEELPLFGGERQKSLFSVMGEPDPPTKAEEDGPLGRGIAVAREALHKTADTADQVLSALQMAATPMAQGNAQTRAVAKRFATDTRRNDWEFFRADRFLERNFSPARRREMFDALDQRSVYEQLKARENIPEGEDGSLDRDERQMLGDMRRSEDRLGLNRLSPDERAAVTQLNETSKKNLRLAKRLGMYQGEGIPWYAPRYLVEAAGEIISPAGREPGGVRPLNRFGQNLRTTTARLLHRKHLTVEQTEQAAQQKLQRNVAVVRDIRAVAHANHDLTRAIAGRALIERIRRIGHQTGQLTVSDGSVPEDPAQRWFTIQENPAFWTRTAILEKDPEYQGKMRPLRDSEGRVRTMKVPIYVRGDFEGPLRSVLSTDGGMIYRGFMAMKAKSMTVIMYSPVIHNQVEWGRALPAMPGKVATFRIYFEGNAAKRGLPYAGVWQHIKQYTPGLSERLGTAGPPDPATSPTMTEAINAGMVPIGHWYGYQDISGVLQQKNLVPGRSWTANVLGVIPGLFDPKAGEAVRRAIDRAGDIWHNALLWDRVGDLQMGLYVGLRDQMIRKLAAKGITGRDAEHSAQVVAAHMANRYAGALPLEAMSGAARRWANFLAFSRSFSLGNLGVMKDAITGLPKDAQAQILEAAKPVLEKTVRNLAARKAFATMALDIGLLYASIAILSSALAIMAGDSSLDEEAKGYVRRLNRLMLRVKENPGELLNPFWDVKSLLPQSENEPGKEDYVKVGNAGDGTAIYMNSAMGKMGREFEGWMTGPLDMLRRKAGTIVRPALQVLMNDDGFGNKVYDPWSESPTVWVKNIGRIAALFFQDQLPYQAIRAAADWYAGRGERSAEIAQILGPLALGATFSKGAPGGPMMGEMYRAKDEFWFRFHEAMPGIRRDIQDHAKDRNFSGAVKDMAAIGVPPGLMKYEIETTLNPKARFTGKQMRDFMQYASPEMKSDMLHLMNEEGTRPQ
jgi:hypothetical protein